MDKLRITKVKRFDPDSYVKPLKVTLENHAKVKAIADETGRNISEVANMIVEFACNHIEIEG